MEVRCEFRSANGVQCPFDLPTIDFNADGTLSEALAAVAPHKTGFWLTEALSSLVVETTTGDPFGLSRGQVEASILQMGLAQAAEAVSRRFGVDVVTADDVSAEAGGCRVDLESFCALHAIATTGSYADAILVACFLAPASVYVFRVPRGTPLGDVLRSAPALADHLDGLRDELPVHILSGDRLTLDTGCTHRTSMVYFPGQEFALRADDSWLFPFPVFNRLLGMRPATARRGTAEPCTNCLACQRFCPAGVRPSFLYHHIRASDDEGAVSLGLNICYQCGWCSHVCPSHLPIAQTLMAAADRIAEEASQ